MNGGVDVVFDAAAAAAADDDDDDAAAAAADGDDDMCCSVSTLAGAGHPKLVSSDTSRLHWNAASFLQFVLLSVIIIIIVIIINSVQHSEMFSCQSFVDCIDGQTAAY